MKKIYCSVLIILIFPILFSFNVFAYDTLDSETIADKLNTHFGDELTYNSSFTSYVNSNFSYGSHLVFVYYPAGNSITLYKKADSNPILYEDRIIFPDCFYISNSGGSGYSYSSNTFYFNNSNVLYFSNGDEMYNFFHVNIDFDTLYYSPLIPTPILNQYYTSYNEAGINIPYVPLTFDLANGNENYYIQIKVKYYTPSVVRVDGANKYNVQARNGFSVHDVYDMQSLTVSTDFNRDNFYSDISDAWTDDLNEFAFSNVEMINGLQSTIGSTADAYFLAQTSKYQQLRNIQTVYGNITEIWARYFSLDDNNNVIVGKWYHWWSLASDSFDEQLPEYVIPYEKAFGTENTTDNNNAPDQVGTTNGTGTSSNPNQNTTYVSVVPNYPDYPTIASYNKDNLLVDTITKMLEVKDFFGEFNDFLTVSFVWVPDWIWGLIGIGFGLSILVFFLRML